MSVVRVRIRQRCVGRRREASSKVLKFRLAAIFLLRGVHFRIKFQMLRNEVNYIFVSSTVGLLGLFDDSIIVIVSIEILQRSMDNSLWRNALYEWMLSKQIELIQRFSLVEMYDVKITGIVARWIRSINYCPISYLKR